MSLFERLLYTDCAAGQGRGPGPGFQVQAQSAGVDAAQARAAVRWLVYEVQDQWVAERRTVADFPQAIAHTAAEGWGTSQGLYLGKEVSGVGRRTGNILADCLLTRDPASYGATRPVQLWDSPVWRATPWPATDCPTLEVPPANGPLDAEAVAEWLRRHPAYAEPLARLLSVLEQPDGPRVFILASDPMEALFWIAAATLLLPMEQALDVSFKVFAAHVRQAEHRVVGVVKQFSPVRPGAGGSALVLDAQSGECDEGAVSERARYWVGRLMHDDAFDVVDAVELAHHFAVPGITDEDVWSVARLVTAGADGASADVAALARWLPRATPCQLDEASGAVSRVVDDAAFVPTAEFDAVLSQTALVDERISVRLKLLAAEVAAVEGGKTLPATLLPALPWTDAARRDAESMVTDAILLGGPEQSGRYLSLANRHQISPPGAPVARVLREFVAYWLRVHPEWDPSGWVLREEIRDLARDVLRLELESRPTAARTVIRQRWRFLAQTQEDPTDPVGFEILMASLQGDTEAGRDRALQSYLSQVPAHPDPPDAHLKLQHLITDAGLLTVPVATAILQFLPPRAEVLPSIRTFLGRVLVQARLQPNGQVLEIRRLVLEHADSVDEQLVFIARTDEAVDGLIAEIRRTPPSWQDLDHRIAEISKGHAGVVQSGWPAVLTASLRAPVEVSASLLRSFPNSLAIELMNEWSSRLTTRTSPIVAALGFAWHLTPYVPEDWREVAIAHITSYWQYLGLEQAALWSKEVAKYLPKGLRTRWKADFLEAARAEPDGRRLRLPRKGGRRG